MLTNKLAIQVSQTDLTNAFLEALQQLPGKLMVGNNKQPDVRTQPSYNDVKKRFRQIIAVKFHAKYN